MQFCPFLVSFWEAGIQAAKQDEKNYSANGRKQCQGWAEGDRKPEGESPPVATYVLPIGFFKVFIESVSLLFSWSQRPDLNRGPTDYESDSNPTPYYSRLYHIPISTCIYAAPIKCLFSLLLRATL